MFWKARQANTNWWASCFSRKDAACYKYKFCTNLGRFFLPLGASITAVSGSSGSSKGSSSDRHFLFRFLSSDTIRFITFRFIRLTFLLGRWRTFFWGCWLKVSARCSCVSVGCQVWQNRIKLEKQHCPSCYGSMSHSKQAISVLKRHCWWWYTMTDSLNQKLRRLVHII